MGDRYGEEEKTVDIFRKSRVALRERRTERHVRLGGRHVRAPRCRKCERKELMGPKNPAVSRSRLSTETRFTTAPRRTPAAPAPAFALHPLELPVLLDMGLRSGDPPRLPQLSSCVHIAHGAILHPPGLKDRFFFAPTFPSEALCPENAMQRLLLGVCKFSVPAAPSLNPAEGCTHRQNADDLPSYCCTLAAQCTVL